jgi:hypothetical protein
MRKKICFKCGIEKPLSEFYKHARMADGYLNKCKECAKKDVSDRYDKSIIDPEFLETERKRGREKYRRLYAGTAKANPERNKRWIERYPEKREASLAAQRIKKDGYENHHWSYLEEHYKDVIHLTKKDHMKAHRFIIYDQERRKYRRSDNNILLDTKEDHLKYILWCIKHKDD